MTFKSFKVVEGQADNTTSTPM